MLSNGRHRRSMKARTTSRLAVGALILAALTTVTPAQATPVLGGLVLNPSSDTTTSDLPFPTANGNCDPQATNFKVVMRGAGLKSTGVNVIGNTSLSQASGAQFQKSFMSVFSTAVPAIVSPSGTYTVSFECVDATGFTDFGDFVSNVTFTHDPNTQGAFDASWTSAPASAPAQATTTSVAILPAGTATTTQTVQMTATLTPSTAAGTVQFSSNGTNIGSPVTVSSGTASLSQTLAAGSYNIQAAFTPTDPTAYVASSSSATPYTVTATSTVTALSASPASPIVVGQAINETASVSPAVAGSVQFTVDGSNVGSPVAVSNGTAHNTISSLAKGSHTLGAVFTPTDSATYGGSSASTLPYTVNANSTTTTVSVSPASPVYQGTPVTISAAISPAAAAGTVQFQSDGSNVGAPVTVSNGSASTSTSTLPVGTHALTAIFTPTDANTYNGSTGTAAAPYTVNTPPPATSTTTALALTPASPIDTLTQVSGTATVSPSSAVGSIQFTLDGANFGSPVAISGGSAAFPTGTLPKGNHSVGAIFVPSDIAVFKTSSAAPVSYVVTAITPANTLTLSQASPIDYGTSETLTATITTGAAGTVQFMDGTATLGTPQTVSGGVAHYTGVLPAGTHSLTAVFTPTDANTYDPSTSSTVTLVVNKKATGITFTVAPTSPQVYGTHTVLSATVTGGAAGTVQFSDGTTNLGGPQTVSNGQVSYDAGVLPVGTHHLNAVFTPTDTADYLGSSAVATQVVNQAPTTTTLAVSTSSPASYGANPTLTATVSPAVAGTVQFRDGATNIGSPQSVNNGQASVATGVLPVGSHSFTAVFTPADATNYGGSTSAASAFVVNQAATTTALVASPASPVAYGTNPTLTATVSPAVAGTVQFLDGSTAVGAPQTVNNGQASVSAGVLSIGSHSLTAVFTPTDATNYSGSTSTPMVYAVGAVTTTTLSVTPTSGVDYTTTVQQTATVSPASAAGSIQFSNGNTNLGAPVPLNNGTATYSGTLPAGSDSLVATFIPTDSSAYAASAAAPVAVQVAGPAPAPSPSPSSTPSSSAPAPLPAAGGTGSTTRKSTTKKPAGSVTAPYPVAGASTIPSPSASPSASASASPSPSPSDSPSAATDQVASSSDSFPWDLVGLLIGGLFVLGAMIFVVFARRGRQG